MCPDETMFDIIAFVSLYLLQASLELHMPHQSRKAVPFDVSSIQ